MKKKNGFIISTTLYLAFGIMMITVASILFVLSTKTATMTTMTDKLKTCIEECDTPENICDGTCEETDNHNPCSLELGYENTLACRILYDDYGAVNPSAPTQSSKGLFEENTLKGKTYYYRGNVDNNYVKIDDTLFRIVRINDDLSIKLIAEESIGSGYFDKGMYIDKIGNSSNIKRKIEQWISNKNFDNQLYSSLFCGSMMGGLNFNYTNNHNPVYSETTEFYTSYIDGTPLGGDSFDCPYYSLLFYSEYGLLTKDEVNYAGANGNISNPSYLSTGGDFATLSINGYYSFELDHSSDYYTGNTITTANYEIIYTVFVYDNLNNSLTNIEHNNSTANINTTDPEFNIRPVIILHPGVTLDTDNPGSGSKSDPFIINPDKIIDDIHY